MIPNQENQNFRRFVTRNTFSLFPLSAFIPIFPKFDSYVEFRRNLKLHYYVFFVSFIVSLTSNFSFFFSFFSLFFKCYVFVYEFISKLSSVGQARNTSVVNKWAFKSSQTYN